ncbi:MAG TPA: hypothetical protein DHV63_09410 [Pseudomonas sp.]|nr:hypothetical protein [Pseudomonas sp.]
MKQLQEMKAERDQSMRNVLRLEEKLTALTREQARAKQAGPARDDYSPWEERGCRVELNTPSPVAALSKQIASTKRELSDARQDVSGLDRRIAYREELLSADQSLKKAVAAERAASKQLDDVRFERAQMADRLDRLEQEAAAALEEARAEETASKEAYAASVTASDGGNEAAAADRLEMASSALTKALYQYQAKQQAFGKLRDGLAQLDAAVGRAEQAAGDAAQSVARAQAFKLSAQWDAEVERLKVIGGQLLLARKQAGLPVDELSKLYLPKFDTLHATPLSIRDLERCADAGDAFQLMAS